MSKEKKAQVFFADFRARGSKENKISKIEKLFRIAGFDKILKRDDLTAIKIHFGERGNDTFINPVFVRTIVNMVHKSGAKAFVTDTNTLYKGSRHNAVDHLTTAMEHGFSYATINAPIVIADGLHSNNFVSVPIHKKYFENVKIAESIAAADSMVVLSHFKGHELAGFGGAIKNMAMGCSIAQGKKEQHAFRFDVDGELCIACGLCMGNCPENAISWIKNIHNIDVANIDKDKCVGCGECLTVCEPKAVGTDTHADMGAFCERMVEYAYGAAQTKKERVCYINFLINITPDCDCVSWSDTPLVPDIGIVASFDLVALDKASYDLVNKQEGLLGSHLKCNHAPGQDKFKGTWENSMGEVQLKYAAEIGLGSLAYELVVI